MFSEGYDWILRRQLILYLSIERSGWFSYYHLKDTREFLLNLIVVFSIICGGSCSWYVCFAGVKTVLKLEVNFNCLVELNSTRSNNFHQIHSHTLSEKNIQSVKKTRKFHVDFKGKIQENIDWYHYLSIIQT